MATIQNTDLLVVARGAATYKATFKELSDSLPHAVDASETAKGVVELATAAETTAGTDDTRAVHPAGLKVELDKKAPLASPALTGTPTAPTAATGTKTTQVATTAFVDQEAVWTKSGTTLSPKTTGDKALSSDVGFTQAGTGAVARTVESKLKDVVSVKDFGAVGDGVTDDTAAIQAAINAAAASSTAKEVVFPSANISGFYKTTAPLVVTKPIRLRGESLYGVTIMGTGLSVGQYILDCDNAVTTEYFYEIENITLRSNNNLPNALRLKNCSYTNLRNVQFFSVNTGAVVTGTVCFSNDFSRVHGYNITTQTVRYEDFTGGGQHKFDGCTFTGDVGFSLYATALTDGLCFVNCNFEQCVTSSMYIGGTCKGLSIVGCRTEGCNGGADFQIDPASGQSVNGLTITGCNFVADAGALAPILLGGAGGKVRGFSITGNSGGYVGNPNFVVLNGDGESGIIAGNSTVYSTSIVNARRPGVVVFGNEYSNGGGGKNDESWGTVPWAVTESTWTPTDASGAGLTFTSVDGCYQRIANMVFFHGHILYPATADTSTAVIGGLPFTIFNTSAARAGATISLTDSPATGLLLLNGTTTLRIQAGGFANGTNAAMSGKEIYFSGFYRIGA